MTKDLREAKAECSECGQLKRKRYMQVETSDWGDEYEVCTCNECVRLMGELKTFAERVGSDD